MLHQRTKGLDKIGLQQSAVLIIVMLKGSRNNILNVYLTSKRWRKFLEVISKGHPYKHFRTFNNVSISRSIETYFRYDSLNSDEIRTRKM